MANKFIWNQYFQLRLLKYVHVLEFWKVVRFSRKYGDVWISNTQSITTFSKFQLWWAICIVDTLCTPGPEFEEKNHFEWVFEFRTSQFLFFIPYLTSKTLILGLFLDWLYHYCNLSQKTIGWNTYLESPCNFGFKNALTGLIF